MFRSFLAIIAGLVTVIVLSIGTDAVFHAVGFFPPWGEPMSDALFGVSTAYRVVYAILGCYIAARLAPDRPMMYALILGTVGFALSLAGAVATWNAAPEIGPRWYPLALVATALPCAWIGGKLCVMQLRAR